MQLKINTFIPDINNSISSSRSQTVIYSNEALFELFDNSLCIDFKGKSHRGKS